MSGARGVVLALLVSLALHVGLALALRGLGLGPGARSAASPLFVALVEPLVALSAPPRSSPPAPAAPRRAPPSASSPSSPAPGAEPPASRASSVPRATPTRPPAETNPPPPPPVPPAASSVLASAPVAPAAPGPAPAAAAPPASEREVVGMEVAVGERASGGAASSGGAAGPLAPPGGDGPPGAAGPAGGAREGGAEGGTGRSVGDLAALPGGRGTALPPEYEAYVRALRRRIQERLEYPPLAVRRGLRGMVELELRLGPDGRLDGVRVVGGEGAEMLREAAIRAVRNATPLPFPPGLAPRALWIRLPVRFELQ